MPYVLPMAALELRYPVTFLILVVSRDSSLHKRPDRSDFAGSHYRAMRVRSLAAARGHARALLNASAAVASMLLGGQALHFQHGRRRCWWEVEHEVPMNIHVTTGPIVSLIAGILILVIPRLLNYIVAIYLIIIGLLGVGILGGT